MQMKYKEIPWYEWLYWCDECWNIISLRLNRIMKFFISNSWYWMINLFKYGWRKKFYLHRLVALTYIWESSLEVNHKDWNKLNNSIQNIEYVTSSENIKHSYNSWLRFSKKWKDNVLSKSVWQYTKDWLFVKAFWSTVEAFRNTWVHHQTIWQCARWYRNNKTGWGFIWKYL